MPDIICDGCHKKFWWYDTSRHYCYNCREKAKIERGVMVW